MYRIFLYLYLTHVLFLVVFPSVIKGQGGDNTTTALEPNNNSLSLNDGCPPDFYGTPGTSWCYHIGGIKPSDRKTFHNAERACNALVPNSTLASIHSNTDQKFIMTLVASLKKPVWIGLRLEDGNFSWADDTDVTFTNWGENSDSIDKGCVAMQIKVKVAGDWDYTGCHYELPFVCEYEKDPTVAPTIPHYKCGEHYLNFRRSCYRFVPTPLNWFDGEEKCTEEGGHLVRINDRYEEAFMEVLFNVENETEAWIGLTDVTDEYSFSWSDGWPVRFTNWGRGEPDLSSDCVAHQRHSNWVTEECKTDLPFVCEMNFESAHHPVVKPKIPGKCPHKGWLHVEDQCYLVVVNETKSWYEAESACSMEGGNLASVRNKKDNFFIASFMSHDEVDVWIGLMRNDSDESFEWSDQSEVEYFNWADGYPNSVKEAPKDEACTLFKANPSDGRWKTTLCDTRHGYVCKTVHDPLPTTKETESRTTESTFSQNTTLVDMTNTSATAHSNATTTTTTTTSNVNTASASDDSTSLSGAGIAGIVISVILFILLVVSIIYFILRRRSARKPVMPGQAKQDTPRFVNVSFKSRRDNDVS